MKETTVQKKEPIFSRQDLVRLMIPLVIEQLLLMTVGAADTMMVTRAGEAVVSGVSLVDNINMLIINIFSALSTGGAVVVSQYMGRQDDEKARSAAKQLIYVAVLIGLGLMVVALLFRAHILRLVFGEIAPDILSSALVYFLLTAAAYPFIAVYNAGAALFRAMGNSRISMTNSLIVNVINITVNAIMIYGFGMGAAGAGIGTLVSRCVGAILIVVKITQRTNQVYVEKLFHPELHWPVVKTILGIGIPTGIENGMFQVGKILVLSLITSFDAGADLAVQGSTVAANAIANSISGLVIVPGSAMGLAMVTVVGRCMGAGDDEQALSYIKKIMAVAYISMFITNMGTLVSLPVLMPLFGLTPATEALAVEVLRWACLFHSVFWPAAFVLPNALRAAGDAKFTMLVSLVSMWVCRIGMSYLLGASWGLDLGLLGVWFAMFADWIVRIVFFLRRFATGAWKRHQVIE